MNVVFFGKNKWYDSLWKCSLLFKKHMTMGDRLSKYHKLASEKCILVRWRCEGGCHGDE
ncbi:hypothetical protein Hanom_Chr16g01434341 [Helianthus anomalus]